MTYEVLVAELRAAASEHVTIATSLGSTPVEIEATSPAVVGHVELAAWIGAIEEQCQNAHKALRSGQKGLATALRANAKDYESTDQCVATNLRYPQLPWTFPQPSPLLGPVLPPAGTP